METRAFKAEFLRDTVLDGDLAVRNKLVDSSRWSLIYELVFPFEGTFYRTKYSVGATESQMEGPFEYDYEVECTEVREVEKVVKVWENVS